MKTPKEIYRIARRYYLQTKISLPYPVKLYNYQLHDFNNYGLTMQKSIEKHWLYNFFTSRNYLPENKTLSIFGVNGDKLAIYLNKSNYKIFYTIENVHVKLSPWIKYEDLLLNNKRIDLSLGFDYIDHEQYLRFPYWLMTLFSANDNLDSIKQKCNRINSSYLNNQKRTKFCSFISREDYFGDRKYFVEQVSKVSSVNCPGNFMHNDDDLKILFGDNKLEYLKDFKFNLCPENSNNNGYVTEKIFDSISSGCIPIYWGSENKPESEILNQQAIFFLELNGNNENTLKEINLLHQNPKLYKEFISQNILTTEAPDIIFDYLVRLDKKLREIIK